MDIGLKEKVIVIMGGSSGIGLETAKLFLKEGAKVALCGRNKNKLNQAESYLKEYMSPGYLYTTECDVTNKQQVNDFIGSIINKFKKINVLVNSAGYSIMGHFFDITDEQWQEQINLKYFAIINAVQAVYPYMKKEGEGRIVNLNATLAKEPAPHMVATAATRAGLLNLSKTLSNELAPDNILVNSISLGVIRTDQWEKRRKRDSPDDSPEKYYKDLAKSRKVPLGRVGEAEEVANVILFLSSSKASYVYGSNIEVAGALGRAI